ncbi:HAD-superfamily hydrolase [Tilletiaria anomala UBC 951]|uniref:HAD-superfamily hydrolase n=1 Tax=Tilletiaria anomala (strain ATCC 24038 / CBS 436.72 / UBC 951) TaxID=1037660 RepID=A0A066VGC4_TILAU|nr:HAD-superfamily hydrolase [Tilletiaria anomala UBC 951]KDN40782.1 HAD-superfamily hydrolase [Tilletiaria anomala UBC 951]
MTARGLCRGLVQPLFGLENLPSSVSQWGRCFSSSVAAGSASPRSNASISIPSRPLAFAFDIDGVLKAGPHVLPCAKRALRILDGANSLGRRFPYLFITNSGGYDEADRARQFSAELEVDVQEDQVIQAHTVLASLTKLYANKSVLVIGPNSSRRIMKKYGFQDVYTANDLHASAPAAWPFIRPPDSSKVEIRDADFSQVCFAAVMVFHDSRDWGRDAQLMIDVLRSQDGRFGTVDDYWSISNSGKSGGRKQLPLYFSHNDLLWGNDFSVSRFGQGAFRAAVENVWLQTTGRPLESIAFGKPCRLTYEFADALLQERLARLSSDPQQTPPAPASVWMIGDNPASDIAGANAFGWKSALVRTGVYRDALGRPEHEPTLIVDDVEVAIRKVIQEECGVEP